MYVIGAGGSEIVYAANLVAWVLFFWALFGDLGYGMGVAFCDRVVSLSR